MGEKTVGIKLSVGGEKEYTQSFSNAVKQTKLLQTETKSLSQEFQGSANSMEALQKKQENLVKLQESFKQKLEAANTGLSNARKEYTKQAEAVETLRKKLDQAEKSLKEMKDSGQEGTEAYSNQQRAIEELNTALQKQTQNMLTAEGRVTDWNKKVISSEADVRKNSKAIEENGRYLDEAKNSADGCAVSIDEFGKKAKDAGQDLEEAGKQGSTFADVLKANITGDAIVAGVQMVADKAKEAAEYVVEIGSAFEAGMSEVEAISGATGSELEALENKAKSLGSSTKFSATEVAGAMTNMSLAGWSVNQTLSGIDGVLQLAAASGMDLANASQVVTDNISSFNLEASQSTHIADMMAYAQANSSTTAAELGEAYKNCGANMNAAGQDIETTTSIRKLINASKSHKKSVSASEKKKHSDLWQYIVKKYGRSVTNDTIKDIAYYLGVNTSKKPTSKQKSAILAAMKKKGLRTGTQNIVEDQLAWLFENNAQEYVLRKSDGAIMQNMLTGDKVINPQGAENLYNFAMNPDRFLENRSSLDVSAAGIEKLNKLIRQQSERQAKLSGRSQVDNSDILNKMDSMMKDMESTIASMVSAIQNMSLTLDTGAVVGGIRERLNTDNEMAATRRTRGRLR